MGTRRSGKRQQIGSLVIKPRKLGASFPGFALLAACAADPGELTPDPAASAPSAGTVPTSFQDVVRVMDERAPVSATAPPPPITGGTLLATRDGLLAVAADPARDRVSFVELDSGNIVASVELPAGSRPTRIAEDEAGQLHVVLAGRAEVATYSRQGRELRSAAVCPSPNGLVHHADTDELLLACRGGQLLGIDAEGQVREVARLDTDLRDVLLMADETGGAPRVLVSRFRSAELIEVDLDGEQLSRTSLPEVNLLASAAASGSLLPELEPTPFTAGVAWRTVSAADGAVMLHQRARKNAIEAEPSAGGYGGDCGGVVRVAVSKVSKDGAVLTSPALTMPRLAVDIAVSSDGQWWAIADAGAVDPGTPFEFENLDGLQPGVASVAPPAAPLVLPESAVSAPAARHNASVYLFNLNVDPLVGTEDSVVLQSCHVPALTSVRLREGQQATAVAFNPQQPAQLITLMRQPAELVIVDDVNSNAATRVIPLSSIDISDTGHDLFHRVDTAISCAHCHPEGGEDGHTWDFLGFGLRRTQSLETRPAAPFHWDGVLEDMNELMTEVFQGRMGAAPQSPERVEVLAGWLGSLHPPEADTNDDDTFVAQGRALFESPEVGCATCHSGAALSDGALHDVGTSDVPLKTPSLLGVGKRLPLMHDGCARDLAARFDPGCGGGEQHGRTKHLATAELEALVAYLGSL